MNEFPEGPFTLWTTQPDLCCGEIVWDFISDCFVSPRTKVGLIHGHGEGRIRYLAVVFHNSPSYLNLYWEDKQYSSEVGRYYPT